MQSARSGSQTNDYSTGTIVTLNIVRVNFKPVVYYPVFVLRQAPVALTVHLKRFSFRMPPVAASRSGGKDFRMQIAMQMMMGGGAQKYREHVQFSDSLDLAPALSPGLSPVAYDLHGVLVHHGSTASSGHYYSYVKAASGRWYCMDDETVSPVSWGIVQQQRAYMLFYSRRGTSNPPATGKPPPAVPAAAVPVTKPAVLPTLEALPPPGSWNPSPLAPLVAASARAPAGAAAVVFTPAPRTALGTENDASPAVTQAIAFASVTDPVWERVLDAGKRYRVLSENCVNPCELQPFLWDTERIRVDFAQFSGQPPPLPAPKASAHLLAPCLPAVPHTPAPTSCLVLRPQRRRTMSTDDGCDDDDPVPQVASSGPAAPAGDDVVKGAARDSLAGKATHVRTARPAAIAPAPEEPHTHFLTAVAPAKAPDAVPRSLASGGAAGSSAVRSTRLGGASVPLERVEITGGRRASTFGSAAIASVLQEQGWREQAGLGQGVNQWGDEDGVEAEDRPVADPAVHATSSGTHESSGSVQGQGRKRGRPEHWTGRRPDEEMGAALGREDWNALLDAGKTKKVRVQAPPGETAGPEVEGPDNAFQRALDQRREAQSALPGGLGYRKGMGDRSDSPMRGGGGRHQRGGRADRGGSGDRGSRGGGFRGRGRGHEHSGRGGRSFGANQRPGGDWHGKGGHAKGGHSNAR